MKKPLRIVGMIVISFSIFLIIVFVVIRWTLTPNIPVPKSDVPIIYKLEWNNYQELLSVTSIDINVIYGNLNLLNNKAVIEYRVKGKLKGQPGFWKPYVKKIHLAEYLKYNKDKNEQIGNIILSPLIKSREVKEYNGEIIYFDIKVQDYLNTYKWGANIYNVSSGTKKTILKLSQVK